MKIELKAIVLLFIKCRYFFGTPGIKEIFIVIVATKPEMKYND